MKMKTFIILFLVAIMTLSLVACPLRLPEIGSSTTTDPGNEGDPTEVSTSKEKLINVYLIAGQSNAVGYGMDT